MVSLPLAAMTTAWQLGVQEWLMRLAKAPCRLSDWVSTGWEHLSSEQVHASMPSLVSLRCRLWLKQGRWRGSWAISSQQHHCSSSCTQLLRQAHVANKAHKQHVPADSKHYSAVRFHTHDTPATTL